MKRSAQNGTGMLTKNGNGVPTESPVATFGKTDARYWQGVIFKPKDGETERAAADWGVRIAWKGRRVFFTLATPNKTAAATKAKDIYAKIIGAGWDEALVKFKPAMQRKSVLTVGDFLTELQKHWAGNPKTFADYSRSLRTILSQIFKREGDETKFDYVNGGLQAWREKIDSIKLADVTPEKVNKWRIAYVSRADGDPIKERRARITCNSLQRQAKSLFAPELLKLAKIKPPLPFEGVAFYKRKSMRFNSTVDVESVIKAAMRELPQEQLKIFLLGTMAGLRRNEIDKLLWTQFRWDQKSIRIEATEYFSPKTEESAGDVPIDAKLLRMFRGWFAKAAGEFVIESDVPPLMGTKYSHYRCTLLFTRLTEWLRSKGVAAAKPIHELRKEFGSQLCAKYGIYAASRMLRHTDIALTAAHYTDAKERTTFGMGNLLSIPSNITPMQPEKSLPPMRKAGKKGRGR